MFRNARSTTYPWFEWKASEDLFGAAIKGIRTAPGATISPGTRTDTKRDRYGHLSEPAPFPKSTLHHSHSHQLSTEDIPMRWNIGVRLIAVVGRNERKLIELGVLRR